jgi:hypothetical protein
VGGAGLSNAGMIGSLANSGKISGGNAGSASDSIVGPEGGAGVSNVNIITTLNNSGAISGGVGGSRNSGYAGGAGVSNFGTIGTLANRGAIAGGSGGAFGGGGGAGVSNAGTIASLMNKGVISGGNGNGGTSGIGGRGDVAVSNAGTIKALSNTGAIGGGNGGLGAEGGAGADGLSNAGTITTLSNSGAITGGKGGSSTGHFDLYTNQNEGGAGVSNAGGITTLTNTGKIRGGAAGGGSGAAGGDAVSNPGVIATLSNSGAISGGNGGNGERHGGAGGAGISNVSVIGSLANAGTIKGGVGGAGPTPGAAGDAIYSAGAGASIGSITNTGQIIGNVVIDNQASVTVTGGTGKTFGSWSGGAIAIGAGNLTFAGGNTFLGDTVTVDGGNGTVTNKASLRIAAPETITGNFTQSAAGVLGLAFAGDVSGEYGALTVTKLTTLDGGLAIDLTGGFTLATGDSFDILGFGHLAGPGFDALTLVGAACMMAGKDSWTCGGGARLNEVIKATSLDLVVAHASAFGPSSSAIPEPSTWTMMLLGFLGFGGLGLHRRGGRRFQEPL